MRCAALFPRRSVTPLARRWIAQSKRSASEVLCGGPTGSRTSTASYPLALKAGLPQHVADDLKAGIRPRDMAPDEEVVYETAPS